MGNITIRHNEIVKIERVFEGYYKIKLTNGNVHSVHTKDYFNVLRVMLLTNQVTQFEDVQLAKTLNSKKVPIILDTVEIVFDSSYNSNSNSSGSRNSFIQDIIKYQKLTVHRVHFEALFEDVLKNNEKIYSKEFQEKWEKEKNDLIKNISGKLSKL